MGSTPSKFFPAPTPYGNSPDMGTVAQAQAASPAPLNNFLPLNPQAPQAQQQQPQHTQLDPQQGGFQSRIGRLGLGGYQRMNRNLL